MQHGQLGTCNCLEWSIDLNLVACGAAAFMTRADKRIQELLKKVSDLKLRMKELGDENNDLRELCNQKGIQWEDWLAARRHRRSFARSLGEHPNGTPVTAMDALCVAPIVRCVVECSGSVLGAGVISRCFFAAFRQLTAQFRWRYGGRVAATFEGHDRGEVLYLAALANGQLASASPYGAILS